MKRILCSFTFFIGCILLFANWKPVENWTEYNIYEYEMRLASGTPSNAYYNDEKCYRAKISYSKTRDFFTFSTESFDIAFHILERKKCGEFTTRYVTVRAGANGHPYSITEMRAENKFYLTITPIRFNAKYAIDEAGLVISSEDVCRIGLAQAQSK